MTLRYCFIVTANVFSCVQGQNCQTFRGMFRKLVFWDMIFSRKEDDAVYTVLFDCDHAIQYGDTH